MTAATRPPSAFRLSLREFFEHRDRLLVCGHNPVLTDHAFDRVQRPLLILAWCIRGDVEVAAVIVEDRRIGWRRQIVPRLIVERKGICHVVGPDLRPLMLKIDPQQIGVVEAVGKVRERTQAIDLVAVKENRLAHRLSSPSYCPA